MSTVLTAALALGAMLFFGRAFRRTRRKRHLLAAAVFAGLLFTCVYPAAPAETPLPPEAAEAQKQALYRAQTAFAPWYASCKQTVAQIDSLWKRYYRIFEAFENDEISVQTAHVRFEELQQQIGELRDNLARRKAPEELSGDVADAAARLLQKTLDYTDCQFKIARQSALATAPDAVEKDPRHASQVQRLRKIQVLYNPTTLDIAPEIQLFKQHLSAPNLSTNEKSRSKHTE